jgi:(2Fe-2S) ferredoxin
VSNDINDARKEARKEHIGEVARHFLLCTGSDCRKGGANATWSYAKGRISRASRIAPDGRIYRSQVDCLNLCEGGPIGIVYPEGTWYGALDKAAIDRLIDEHLVGGKPVEDLRIAQVRGIAGGQHTPDGSKPTKKKAARKGKKKK